MKRRTWILSALGLGGAMVVGWSVLPPRSRTGAAGLMARGTDGVALNGWLRLAPDGHVVLAMPRSEMGQGVFTALAMLVAEELDLPLERVRIEQAGTDRIYGNVAMFVESLPFHPRDIDADPQPALVRTGRWMLAKVARELGIQVTGGSSTVADAWGPLRLAAATARAQLLAAAARAWQLPAKELATETGEIVHASGKRASYFSLAPLATGEAPGDVAPKPRDGWKLIGQPAPRLDIPAKVDGSARFGIDVRLPDQRYAAIRMSPVLGGTLASVDEAPARALPGVEQVVRLPAEAGASGGVAVIAKTWWQAERAVAALKPVWAAPQGELPDSNRIRQKLEAAVREDKGLAFHSRGDVAAAEAQAGARVVEAVYAAPYLAHAALEPINCTAQVSQGRVQIWLPTQVPGAARDAAAKAAGVSSDQVTVNVTLLGGGFGRRLDVDVVPQAVRIAMAANGQPVQLLWSREEDMGHDFYRPMNVARLRAVLDPQGAPLALESVSAGDAITPRWLARTLPLLAGPIDTPDKTTAEGLIDQMYGFPNQRLAHVTTRSGVPVGFWRSVGHSHNAFFLEGFIDELAEQTKQDPLAFRRALLKEAPRHRAVLDMAANKAGWGTPLPQRRARGIALHESFGTIVAQVAEVSLENEKPRVHRVVCAVDCGSVVNPGIVAQQVEGSVVFALTAALYGRIDIEGGVVRQSSFPDYPLLPLAQAPVVETHLVASDRPPTGMGEPAVPPLAPAVANAVYALTRKRLRTLPLLL